MKPLEITLIQTKTHWHAPQANQTMFENLWSQIPEQSQIVVLPEMFSTGFTMASAAMAEPMSGPTVAWMCAQADALNKVVCGSVVIVDEGQYYNRFIWAEPGAEPRFYDKRHCFRMADEHKFYSSGGERLVIEYAGWRICPMICYDLRFPVWIRNRQDYDVLLCVANWPAARLDAWRTLLKARAIENQAYVVGVNIVGVDGNDVAYSGGSGVYDPVGVCLGEYLDDPIVATHELDYAHLLDLRSQFPVWQDADSFELIRD